MSNSAGNLTARQSNVEILRILAAMGVIALHYNDGAMYTVLDKASNLLVLELCEYLWAWAVNVFIMIMGYFQYSRESSDLKKPLKIVFQVVFFQLLSYVLYLFGEDAEFSVRSLFIQLVPTDYFLAIYIALHIVSPYLNLLFSCFSNEGKRKFLLVLLCIFSIWAYGTDVLSVILDTDFVQANPVSIVGDAAGHSFVNFTLCYFVGSALRCGAIKIKKPAAVFAVVTLAIAALGRVLSSSTAVFYNSPLMLLQAAALISLFSSINAGSIKIINSFGKAGLTVYITHGMFLAYCGREMFMWSRPWVLFAHIVLTQMGLFLAGYLIHQVYTALTEPMFKWVWKKVRLPEIRPIRMEK